MDHTLPTRLTPAQVMTHTNLATYLRTNSYFELGHSLARQSNHTAIQDICPVNYPLCDPSSHLQGDIYHFDRHLPQLFKGIRNCPGIRIRHDKVTYR